MGAFLPFLFLGPVCKQAFRILLVGTRSRHSPAAANSQPTTRCMIHCLWSLCGRASCSSELGQDQMARVNRTSQSVARTKLISDYYAMTIFHGASLFSESQDCLKSLLWECALRIPVLGRRRQVDVWHLPACRLNLLGGVLSQ